MFAVPRVAGFYLGLDVGFDWVAAVLARIERKQGVYTCIYNSFINTLLNEQHMLEVFKSALVAPGQDSGRRCLPWEPYNIALAIPPLWLATICIHEYRYDVLEIRKQLRIIATAAQNKLQYALTIGFKNEATVGLSDEALESINESARVLYSDLLK